MLRTDVERISSAATILVALCEARFMRLKGVSRTNQGVQ